MKKFDVILELLLLLLYGVHVLMIVGAGIMLLGFFFLAGSAPLLMAAPIGIAFIAGFGMGLSLALRTERPGQALCLAMAPPVIAPLWYFFIYKVIEARCDGWVCF